MALTPEISYALAELANALELTPELRQEIARRIPPDAQTEQDLPEDLQWLLAKLRTERDPAAASAQRTLTLAGRPLTFSSATALAERVEACGPGAPDMPYPMPGMPAMPYPMPGMPGMPQEIPIDPDSDGAEMESGGLPRFWRGQLVPYDNAAPDGRIIKAPVGDPQSREMPLPFNAQVATADGHDNAITIGRVNRIWSQDNGLWGEGEFDLGTPEGRDWAGRVARGMAGWGSVDLDAGAAPRVESQGRNKVPKRTYGDWTFAGFTLVSRPAFDSARINSWAGDDGHIDDPRNTEMPQGVAELLADVNDTGGLEASSDSCGCGGAADPGESGQSFPAAGKAGLALGPDSEWDSTAAEQRVRSWAGVSADGGSPGAWNKYGRAFFWKAPQASKLGDFKLPYADVVDGQLRAMPRGVFAAAAAVQGSRGGVDIPGGDLEAVRAKIGSYYKKMKRKAPWDTGAMTASAFDDGLVYTRDGIAGTVTGYDEETGWLRISCGRDASLVVPEEDLDPGCLVASATTGPLMPPDAWFDNPGLSGPTALTIDDDGRAYGHLALFGTCHVKFSDACVQPPRSNTNYSYFHTGEVVAASGRRIPVGKIVMGPGHAGSFAGWRAATMHYDKAGATVAVGRVYEDSYGIVFAGSIVPEAKPAQVAALRRSPLSGDWRKIAGNLELVAALAVSVPGFPVPRPRAAYISAQQASLVAAGVLDREHIAMQDSMAVIVKAAVEDVLEAYAERRERAAAAAQRLASLRAAADDGGCGCGQAHDEDGIEADDEEDLAAADDTVQECTCGECPFAEEDEETEEEK